MNNTQRQRIAAGMEVLDAYYGTPDWDTRIDFATLDMGELERCVLGQLEGRYGRGWMMLYTDYFGGDDDADPADYGFDIDSSDGEWRYYDSLTDAWIEALTARQSARSEA